MKTEYGCMQYTVSGRTNTVELCNSVFAIGPEERLQILKAISTEETVHASMNAGEVKLEKKDSSSGSEVSVVTYNLIQILRSHPEDGVKTLREEYGISPIIKTFSDSTVSTQR